MAARCTQYVVQAFVRSGPGVRVSQMAILAFVTSTADSNTARGGVNSGTPIVQPYPVHLDRKCRLTGSYDGGGDFTVWTLPIADSTLTTIVLASTAFGSNNGKVLTGTYGSSQVTVTGDYSAGPVIIGRNYTMSVELTRPYRRDYNGEARISDRLQHSVQHISHRNTGDYTLRAVMPTTPTRADRTKTFTVTTIGALQEQGETRAMFSGWAEEMRLFIESSLPRPVTITGVEYMLDVAEGQG